MTTESEPARVTTLTPQDLHDLLVAQRDRRQAAFRRLLALQPDAPTGGDE